MEVVRVGGGLDDSIVGGEETDTNQDAEIQDRKLVCMVRCTCLQTEAGPSWGPRPNTPLGLCHLALVLISHKTQ